MFITHDLEEGIGLSDRVLVMSAGPGRVIGEHPLRGERQVDMAHPEVRQRIHDGVLHRGGGPGRARLADPLGAQWVLRSSGLTWLPQHRTRGVVASSDHGLGDIMTLAALTWTVHGTASE